MPQDTWTDDRIAILTKMYAEGHTCRTIAAEIGVTRNAVIGKVGRLGLPPPERKLTEPAKPPGVKIIHRVVRANGNSSVLRFQRTIASTEEVQLRCVEIVPRHLSLIDLGPNDCRYPYGDGPITFCGHPKADGSSYCVPHKHLTSEPPRAPINRFARVAA